MNIVLNKWLWTFLIYLYSASAVYAGENLQGALRAQQQRQQQMQQQAIVQQVAQQRQAIIQQQQQRILQERQLAIQQQQITYNQALQQRKLQQFQAYQQKALQERQIYNQVAQQKVAQEVAYRQMAQQQAYQQNLNERMQQQAAFVNTAQTQLAASQAALQANAQAQYIQPAYVPSVEAEEVTDLEHIWKDLEVSSEIWLLILDREPKELTINRFIESYKKSGIMIRKPASQYVDIIDSMTREAGESMLKMPFKDILKIAAIVEYDFDNGLDKDQMVLRVLGEQGYESNKKRLGR